MAAAAAVASKEMSLITVDSVVRAELLAAADSLEDEEEESMETESDEGIIGHSKLTICEDQAEIGGKGSNAQKVTKTS